MEEAKTLVLTEAESSSNDSLPNVFMLARHDRRGELEQLFKNGVDPDSIDRFGNSLFIIACQNNHKETAKLCLRYGSDIHWQNNKGQSALYFCRLFSYKDLENYLVFLTGGTGAVGKAVLTTLLAHGHRVTCTVKDAAARTALQTAFPDSSALTLVDLLLTPTCGPELERLAADHDCLIHAVHSFADDYHAMEEACLRAFIAVGKAHAASGRPCQLISTTSTASIGATGENEVDETGSTDHPSRLGVWRVPMEKLVLEAAEGLFTTAVVRPVWVYGGSHVDTYVTAAKQRREVVAPAVEGHFGVVHREDLGELYRLIAEKRASGVFHGTEPRPIATSEVVAKVLEVSGVSEAVRTEQTMPYVKDFGYFLLGMEGNQRPIPRRSLELGWSPKYSFLDHFSQLYSS